jgi:osmoprotectant transport system ATP-binding protein
MAADPPIMLMDEPFGAVDPIARDRLQNDFLRLHRQVRKTVIFVTHDIDEALKMGDRIAIMRAGHLVQIATADELLARPADDFVASFVGADRGLTRLRVHSLRDIQLEPASGAEDSSPTITRDTTLHYALSMMLTEGTTPLQVVDGEKGVVGTVRMDAITKLIASDAEPTPPPAAVNEPSAR